MLKSYFISGKLLFVNKLGGTILHTAVSIKAGYLSNVKTPPLVQKEGEDQGGDTMDGPKTKIGNGKM